MAVREPCERCVATTRDPRTGEKDLPLLRAMKAVRGRPDLGVYCDVITPPTAFEAVKKALEAAGLKPLQAEVTMRPANRVAVEGELAEQLQKMVDALEDLDDSQDVYHNAAL